MSKADADALMAAVLATPADPLPRLVFADYLDDTGTPGNAAWAEYIRLRTAAAAEGSAVSRELLWDAAAEAAPRITATLSLPAADFLADVPSFRDLLPGERFTVRLDGFTPRRPAVLPEYCRANRGLPLGASPYRTVIGLIDEATAGDRGFWQTTYKDWLFVRLPTADLEPAIQRTFTTRALALVQPQATATPVPTTLDEQLGAASAEVMRGFVEQLVAQARERRSSAIDITAYATHHWVRRVEGGRAVRWHRVGTALGRELVRTAWVLPARRLHVRVRQRNSSFGDGVRIALLNPPAAAGVLGSGERPA